MAERKQIDINLLLKGVDKFLNLSKEMENLDAKSKAYENRLKTIRAEWNKVARGFKEFDTALQTALAKQGGGSLNDLLRMLRQGGSPGVALQNAKITAQLKQFEATSEQAFQRLTNAYIKGLQNFTRAVESQAILSMAKARQLSAAGDLKTLDQQIAAQRYRVAQAERNPRLTHNFANVRAPAEKALADERAALAALEAARERMVAEEKRLSRETQARVTLEERLRRLQDVRLQELERELVIRKQLREMDRLADPQMRAFTDALSRRRTEVGLERRLAQAADPGIAAARHQLADANRLDAIDRARLMLRARMLSLLGQENQAERVKLRIKDQSLKIEEMLLRSGGQVTDEIIRQQRRLQQLLAAQRERNRLVAEQRALEQAGAPAGVARRTAQNNALAGDRGYIASAGNLAREITNERVHGDGGAFLFGIQAQLLGNYLIMNKLLNLFSFGAQFVTQLDQAFQQLQAITATTNTEMAGLRDRLVEVSELTKFTAVEVAEAATIMGQAGFSTQQIRDSIEGVTLLATATGSDLAQSVDLATSVISVFNLQAGEMGMVANVVTAALNESKLTLDKLSLGVQYAGNSAAEMGVTFSEFAAILGALANSGIRSGSTIGTGLRQLLVAFQAPTETLIARLKDLGISLDQIDVRIHGFEGVMRNLMRSGFTAADAMQVLEVRAGAAFAAFTNNIDSVQRLQTAFLLSNAAAEANAVQMESLSNKWARMTSVFGTFVANAFSPLVELLKQAVDWFAATFQAANRMVPVLQVAGTVIGALAINLAALKIVALVRGLRQGAAAFMTFATGAAAAAAGAGAATAGVTALNTALRFSPAGLLLIGAALVQYLGSAEDAADKTDKLRAKVDESKGRIDKYNESLEAVGLEMRRLIDRSSDLEGEGDQLRLIALELNERFQEMGGSFDTAASSADTLIDALGKLRNRILELKQADQGDMIRDRQALITHTLDRAVGTRIADKDPFGLIGTMQGADWASPRSVGMLRHLPDTAWQQFRSLMDLVDADQFQGTPISQLDVKQLAELRQQIQERAAPLKQEADAMRRGAGRWGLIDKGERERLAQAITETFIDKANEEIRLLGEAVTETLRKNQAEIDQRSTLFEADPEVQRRMALLGELQGRLDTLNRRKAQAKTPEEFNEIIEQGLPVMLEMETIEQDLRRILEERYAGANLGQTDVKKLLDRLKGTWVTLFEGVKDARDEVQKLVDKYTVASIDAGIQRRLRAVSDTPTLFPDAPADVRTAITGASNRTGVPFSYLMHLANVESKFDPKAKNPDTSATGLFQFIESTWLDMFEKYGEQVGMKELVGSGPMTGAMRAKILRLREDPNFAALMAAFYAAENHDFLKQAVGGLIGAPELYLAHFLGPGGAARFLKARAETPDASAARLFPGAAATNKGVFFDRESGAARSLEQVYQLFAAKFATDRTVANVQRERDVALAEFDRKAEILRRQKRAELEQEKLLNTTVGQRVLADLELQLAEERLKIAEGFNDSVRKADEAGKHFTEAIGSITKQVKEIMKDLELARAGNRRRLDELRLQTDATELPQFRDRYSDVQRRDMRERQVALETQALEDDLPDMAEARARLEGLLTRMQDLKAARKTMLAMAQDTVKAYESSENLTVSKEEYATALSQVATAQRDLLTLEEKSAEIRTNLKQIDEQALKTQQELAVRRGENLEATFDWDTMVSRALTQYQQGAGHFMSETARVGDQLGSVFKSVEDGFQGFVQSFVTGSKSIGEAARDMAANIIQAMLDIAAKEVALGLFGFVKGIIAPAGADFSGGSGDTTLGSGIGADRLRLGGLVRAAGGYRVPNRDSVHILAEPGEYVLRKSAVDAVGADTLDRLNAMGNRTVSQGAPSLGPQTPAQPAVTNVWVVPKDQVPPPSRQDIIVWVNEDIAQGGPTKRLIKSVQQGVV